MTQDHLQTRLGQPIHDAAPPLDYGDAAGAEELICPVREEGLFTPLHPRVEVEERQPSPFVGLHQRVGRAGHPTLDPQPRTEPTNEGRLPRTKITIEGHDAPSRQLPTELLTKAQRGLLALGDETALHHDLEIMAHVTTDS